ncbi:hypothetical protein ACHAW5_004945 [Stephanodiscus triporus]|uniref:Subtilisin n=1 Tax=Stephanodiscus triporus TaxID=2934178 RepID=A0ABD3N7V8_9STRA
MDVVTSIDRDFGCGDAWPNFVSVDVVDPVPMFVGDVDGARRHAVGAGLTPLEQPRQRRRMGDDGDRSTKTLSVTIASSGVLRAGLPDSLLRELGEGGGGALGTEGVCDRNDRRDDPWRIAARRGFHPVFDAGVERLMSVVVYGGGGTVVVDGDDDDGTKSGPSPVELWLASTPRYARDHYSSNSGVRDMLGCIRSARLKK